MTILRCGPYNVGLTHPIVMGIINVTTDSFSGDGVGPSVSAAREQAQRFIEEGAAIIDVGGESSRPGAQPVSVTEEIERIVPVIEAIVGFGVPVSIDTWKPQVMCAALAAGATLINDINALQAPGAIDLVARSGAAVCLMHKQGDPQTMQKNPCYQDVVTEVRSFLETRAEVAQQAGIDADRICLDPGFGFGKTAEHNLALLRGIDKISELGFPILVGLSRKSMLGAITGRPVAERAAASIAAALFAASMGARIIRAHDVAATCDALAVWRKASSFDAMENA